MTFSVLLTNSDPDEASRLQQAIAAAGMEVLLCRDAMSTLARTKNTKPNLLVLADDLPDASGFDLCDSVRRKSGFSHIPTIILVGPAHEAEAEEHRSRGAPASAYLPRPADADAVLSQVRSLLSPGEAVAPPPLPRPTTFPSGPPPPPAPEVPAEEPPAKVSSTFEGLPDLPPLPTGLPPPTLPPLPPPNPLTEGDPFQEPTDARPPRTGSPDEKVTYFRTLVKSKDETLTRARGVFASKQQEVLSLREHLRLRELQLGDMLLAREKDLLTAVRTREVAFLEHLRGFREEADHARARLEAESRDERRLLGEKQRKELQDRDAQLRHLQVTLEEVQAQKAAATQDAEKAIRSQGPVGERLAAAQARNAQLEHSVEEAVGRRDEAERTLRQRDGELEARQTELAKAVADLEELRAAALEKDDHLNQARARLDELAETSRRSLGEAHANLDSVDAKLQQELAGRQQAQVALETCKGERDLARAEAARLGPELAAARSEMESLRQSRADLEHRTAEHRQNHDRLSAELALTQRELENERRAHNASAVAEIDARERLEEVEGDRAELRKSLAATEAARLAIENERDSLRKEADAQRERLASLQATLEEMEGEARALEQSAAEVDEEHQRELSELEGRRAELEKTANAQDLELASLRKHDEDQARRLTELTEKLEIEEMQSRALLGVQADLDASHRELEVLRPKAAELEAAEKQLADRAKLQADLERTQSLAAEHERKLAEARALAEAQADELGELDQKVTKLEEALGQSQAAATHAEGELAGEKQARASAERALDLAEKGRGGRVGELEKAAQEAEVRVRDLEGRLDRSEAELRELTATHEAEARARETTERRASGLQAKLTESAPRLAHLEEAHFAAESRATDLQGQVQQLQQQLEAEHRRAEEMASARASLEQQLAAQRARADAAQRDSRGKATAEERIHELEERLADHEESARAMADSHEKEQFEADWALALAENAGHDALAMQAAVEDELDAARARVRELEAVRSRPDPRSVSLEAEVERLRTEVERLKRDQRDGRPSRREPSGPPVERAPAHRATTLEAPQATDQLASSMNQEVEEHTTVGPAPLPPTRPPSNTRRGEDAPRRSAPRTPPPVEDSESEAMPETTTIAPMPKAPERKRDRETTLPRTRPKGRSRR